MAISPVNDNLGWEGDGNTCTDFDECSDVVLQNSLHGRFFIRDFTEDSLFDSSAISERLAPLL